MTKSVFVLGSYIHAHSLFVPQLPQAGESVQAAQLWRESGGKGLNLALGMHRLGLVTHSVFAVGQDSGGDALLDLLQQEGLNTTGVRRLPIASGFGVGLVADDARNVIAIYPGANAALRAQHIDALQQPLRACQLVCAQCEIPDEPIVAAFQLARQHGTKTLLNPSPWHQLDAALLALTDIWVLNESEALAFFGMESVSHLALVEWLRLLPSLHWQGELLVITLAERGCVALQRGQAARHEPAWTITPIDPTGAGDAFSAGLVYALLHNYPLPQALRFANACGAIVAAQPGVLKALPTVEEVAHFMHARPQQHKLHPAMWESLLQTREHLTTYGLTQIFSQDIERLRAFIRGCCGAADEKPPTLDVIEDYVVTANSVDIPLRLYKAKAESNLPILLWFHGGGWVLGDINSSDTLCRFLAIRSHCAVLSVGYRLAPEHPCPHALQDAQAVLHWLQASAAPMGLDKARIAVGGESAGANLATVLAQLADKSVTPLRLQVLLYPVVDADFTRVSYCEYATHGLLTRAAMEWFWDCYTPDLQQRSSPIAVPLCSDRLDTLPPTLMITAECDPLRDEGAAYALALQVAGVTTDYYCALGMAHDFLAFPNLRLLPEVQRVWDKIVQALQQAFDPPQET